MAVTYTTAVKTARMQAVVTQIGSTGVLEIGNAAVEGGSITTILATISLNSTAGTVTNGVLTLSGFPKSDTAADASGTANSARIRTATGGTDIITGLTVGTTGKDVNLDSVSITTNQTVTINSATITHAA